MGTPLTDARRKILSGAQGEHGIIEMPYRTGFEAVSWRRNAMFLAGSGLIEPRAHGGFYITDAGRAALTSPTGGV